MVITSEALTFKPREPVALQGAFRSTSIANVADDVLPPAIRPVSGEQADPLRSTGFVKASAADLEDMKALAKLQAAARRAADVQRQPVVAPVEAANRIESLDIAPGRTPEAPAVGFSSDIEARLPSFEVVAEPALTASIGNSSVSDGLDQHTSADTAENPDGVSDAVETATAEEQLAMLPRLPLPRPDPPKTRVRKARSGGSLGPAPDCGTKHAYWRNRGGNKVWYCR